jgi:hypothetical protein
MMGSSGTSLRNIVTGNPFVRHPRQPIDKKVTTTLLTKLRNLWHKKSMNERKSLFYLKFGCKAFLMFSLLESTLLANDITYKKAKKFFVNNHILGTQDFKGIEDDENWAHTFYPGCWAQIGHVDFPSVKEHIFALECYRTIGKRYKKHFEEHPGCWIKVCAQEIDKEILSLRRKAEKEGKTIPEKWTKKDIDEEISKFLSPSSSQFPHPSWASDDAFGFEGKESREGSGRGISHQSIIYSPTPVRPIGEVSFNKEDESGRETPDIPTPEEEEERSEEDIFADADEE